MSITKFFALAAVAATTVSAFALDTDKVLWFPKSGHTYSDKTAVTGNEWYALCWSQDGVFEGINPDYTAMDAGDKVLLVDWFPNSPKGRFNIPASWGITTGQFCVILLDTRDANGVPAEADADGKPVRMTAAIASSTMSVITTSAATATTAKAPVANADWGATNPQPATPAKIISINPSADGDNVEFVIDDTCPDVRYDLMAGSEPGKLDKKYVANEPKKGEGQITITAPKNEAKFYQLTTAPMTK